MTRVHWWIPSITLLPYVSLSFSTWEWSNRIFRVWFEIKDQGPPTVVVVINLWNSVAFHRNDIVVRRKKSRSSREKEEEGGKGSKKWRERIAQWEWNRRLNPFQESHHGGQCEAAVTSWRASRRCYAKVSHSTASTSFMKFYLCKIIIIIFLIFFSCQVKFSPDKFHSVCHDHPLLSSTSRSQFSPSDTGTIYLVFSVLLNLSSSSSSAAFHFRSSLLYLFVPIVYRHYPPPLLPIWSVRAS